MKNIRFYHPSKYDTDTYIKVKDNIYSFHKSANADDGKSLKLKQISDDALAAKLRGSTWTACEGELEDGLCYLESEGKKYYKDVDDDSTIYELDTSEELIYVTSIMFEPEPEYGENAPTDVTISQYPLEDILDKYSCWCEDFYHQENADDPANSYIEFASRTLDDIENLLNIVGKHVYNQANGDAVSLVVE